nr:MAG TPA: hypothetical protein [Caudoviricetes sp.]
MRTYAPFILPSCVFMRSNCALLFALTLITCAQIRFICALMRLNAPKIR